MDIHKPKSWHGWRDFLKEFATIVLGVSVALAAEQGVEWWHWRQEVELGRKALVAEITDNNRFFNLRIANAACMKRQVREADAIINAIETKQKPPTFTTFHRGVGLYLSDSEWQSERASQVLTHFPRSELAILSSYYTVIPDFRSYSAGNGEVWNELSILQNPPAGLGPSDIARLRTALDKVRFAEAVFLFNSYRTLNVSDRLGIARPRPEPYRTERFCKLSDDALFDALAKAAARGQDPTRPQP